MALGLRTRIGEKSHCWCYLGGIPKIQLAWCCWDVLHDTKQKCTNGTGTLSHTSSLFTNFYVHLQGLSAEKH
jgi:hypothetical protein